MMKRRQIGQFPRIAFIPRPNSSSPQRIRPINHETMQNTTPSTNFGSEQMNRIQTPEFKSTPAQKPVEQTEIVSPSAIRPKPKVDTQPSVNESKQKPIKTSVVESEQKKNSNKPIEISEKKKTPQNWWNSLPPNKKRWIKIILVILAILGICLIIILATILPLVVFKRNSDAGATSSRSVCSTTTCIGQETARSAFQTIVFPFDGNFNDLTGFYSGIGYGSTIPGCLNNIVFVGSQALALGPVSLAQYVQIPEINLSSRSFTIQMYIYIGSGTTLAADYGIFSQCDVNNICLTIHLRYGRIAVSFDSMNTNKTLSSTSIILNGRWIHIAIVYDATTLQQLIYLNGAVSAVSIGTVASFQGQTTGSTTVIGRTVSMAFGTSYFAGRIDHLIISPGTARTACQIYNDFGLVAYFPFDSSNPMQDNSVNYLNGVGASYTITSARIRQGLTMNSNLSYFQTQAFTSLDPSNNNVVFSISLWVNPTSLTNGGSLVHYSIAQSGNGSNCYDIMTFTTSGALLIQIINSATVVTGLLGPVIPTNTWTHVVMIYSSTNGMRLYINGELSVASQNITSIITVGQNTPQYLTIGNNSPQGNSGSVLCRSGHVAAAPGPFVGSIDDFRFYSRELDNQEVCVLSQM